MCRHVYRLLKGFEYCTEEGDGIDGSSRSIGRILALATSPSAVGTADKVLLPSRSRRYRCGLFSRIVAILAVSTTNRSGFSAHSPA